MQLRVSATFSQAQASEVSSFDDASREKFQAGNHVRHHRHQLALCPVLKSVDRSLGFLSPGNGLDVEGVRAMECPTGLAWIVEVAEVELPPETRLRRWPVDEVGGKRCRLGEGRDVSQRRQLEDHVEENL